MRYSLALYCSDLKDSTKDFVPVGVLVVDEDNHKYAFKYLDQFSGIQAADVITKAMWQSMAEHLEQRFEQYCQKPDHNFYKEKGTAYHGFISQMIQDSAQSTICFSDSIPIEEKRGSLEAICSDIFKKIVLRSLD